MAASLNCCFFGQYIVYYSTCNKLKVDENMRISILHVLVSVPSLYDETNREVIVKNVISTPNLTSLKTKVIFV